ncbi:ATP-grasp domain-containing protein [Nonomuraea gerenzanensis]|uniref:Phosphoribosylamine--glycine ligase n=1 Tax=Nonomuraea gerenzanensis TaxID=93944 RepID=A0A1M4EM17_9ACTN|nr:ATP-grasp domain-containing protein [Nonomuraea gerenzanensis]UBU11407.1 ATP-grasp domain-containing protein [Nonomuraea gerenzanensis]SBO99890.1 Phosphoribosylamine--glycine ligase [Nonomuraea gerenzanensis]
MKRLVVVGTGPRLYREFMLRQIGERYEVHLVIGRPAEWETPYIAGATVVPGMTAEGIVAAVGEIVARQAVHGVMTWAESHVVDTALAAAAVGLPGPGPGAARACRDKHATRSALAARGVPQPQSVLVGDVAEAHAAAEKFGYPVVVKPRAGVASQAVALVRDGAELAEHFAPAHRLPAADLRSPDRSVLIEEYLTGPEVAVDCVLRRGHVMPVVVSHKELGYAPYFEETGHWTRGDDPLLGDPAITRFLTQVHAAVGFSTGATHTEFKLTDEGPKLIEINGRLGGDLISYLCHSASGVDPGLALAAVSCGDAPDLTRTRALCAGIRFAYPPWHRTRVEEIAFSPAGLPPEAGLAVPLVGPGEVVLLPHKDLMEGRVAFVTATAATREELSDALGRSLAALRCTWSPA